MCSIGEETREEGKLQYDIDAKWKGKGRLTDCVRDSRYGAGGIELAVREGRVGWVFSGVGKLELSAGPVEGAELDGYLREFLKMRKLKEAKVPLTQAPIPIRGVRVPCEKTPSEESYGDKGIIKLPCRMLTVPHS